MVIWTSYEKREPDDPRTPELVPELLNDAVGIEEVMSLWRCIFEEFFLVHGLMLTAWEDLSTPDWGSRDDHHIRLSTGGW